MTDGSKGQMALPIQFFRELDRNFHKGGRSFYFFDLDDNVLHLPSELVLFKKNDSSMKSVSTEEWIEFKEHMNNSSSPWFEYESRFDERYNSFMNFRDRTIDPKTEEQALIIDLRRALNDPQVEWKGPSWNFFAYAVENSRPLSIITARGHHPHTIKRAINHLVQTRDLVTHPNYLGVYPVSHTPTRVELDDKNLKLGVPELKKRAIHQSVKDAFDCYGYNPHHRFGMSDDDPENLKLILEAFAELKKEFPENAFFAFNTQNRKLVKHEVTIGGGIDENDVKPHQGKLFDDE
jgi:hypothetical protein